MYDSIYMTFKKMVKLQKWKQFGGTTTKGLCEEIAGDDDLFYMILE